MYDVLLINPGTEKESRVQNREPPQGIMLLAAIIEKAEYSVEICDCSEFPDNLSIIPEKASQFRLIGVTTLTNTLYRTVGLIDRIKQKNPSIPIIVGGPHASFCYEALLNEYSGIDIVAVGEAENIFVPFLDLVLKQPAQYFDSIEEMSINKELIFENLPPGLALRALNSIFTVVSNNPVTLAANKNAKILFKGWPEPVDINKNPLPARHLLRGTYDVANIIFNRGCPNQCSFCSRQKLFKNIVRIRDLSQIREEIEQIRTLYRYKFVNFYDNINVNPKIFRAFLQMLIDMKFKIPWGCELRADILTEEECKLMKQAGCAGAATGIESADIEVLKRNFKEQNPEKVKRGIQMLKKAGIVVQGYFVIGLPGETLDSFRRTLQFFDEIGFDKKDEVNFFIATPYPGSRLADQSHEFGITITSTDYECYDCDHFLFETGNLKEKDIMEMYAEAKERVRQLKH